MARSRKNALRKNPSGLTVFLVAGTLASLAGGAWWWFKMRGQDVEAEGRRKVGVDTSAFSNVRGSTSANLQAMKGGGGTLASLKANTERAEKARARRDRILAEREAGGSEELALEGQMLDTSLPVG